MTNPTNNSPQDNRDRVSEDAARSLQNILNSVRTAVENEFAIQQMEYDELYGVDSEEYETYQNKIGTWLKTNKLIDMVADLLPLSLMMDMVSPSNSTEMTESNSSTPVENPWGAPAEAEPVLTVQTSQTGQTTAPENPWGQPPVQAQAQVEAADPGTVATPENPWAVPAQQSFAEAEVEVDQSYQSGAYAEPAPEPTEYVAPADNPWGQPEAQPQTPIQAQAPADNPWGQPEAQPQTPIQAQAPVDNPWGQPVAQPQAPLQAQAPADNPWGQPVAQPQTQAQVQAPASADNPWAAPPQQEIASYQNEANAGFIPDVNPGIESAPAHAENPWSQPQEDAYRQVQEHQPMQQQMPAQSDNPWGSPVESTLTPSISATSAAPQNPWGSPVESLPAPQAPEVSSGAWQDISAGSIPAVQQGMPVAPEQPAAPSLDALFPQAQPQQQEHTDTSTESDSYLPSQAWMSSDPDMQPTMPMPPPPPPIPPTPGPEYAAESNQYSQAAQPAMDLDAIGDDQFGDLEDDTVQGAEQPASFMPPAPPPMPPVPPADPSSGQPAAEEKEEDKFKFDPSSAWG